MSSPAIIECEGNGYVSLCPELDIASQGNTIEQARGNLKDPGVMAGIMIEEVLAPHEDQY
ncbi:MAG TPA: hypothetical protein VLK23_06625 [Thermodesulfobacteriota bacterium]|nr:hypothetical protein [Thermodesulfobacteriota bacterium]